MKTSVVNLARISKMKRALRFALGSVTLKKLVNAGMAILQMAMGSGRLYSYPFVLKVEASNRCNLRCRGCYSHDFENPFPKGEMELGLFKKIVDELGDYLFLIKLYVWGEPLLNKELFDMIAYARARRVAVAMSTNLNALTHASAQRLVSSGLDHLIVGLDGATQAVYEKTRINGDLGRALRNLELVLTERAAAGSRRPFVEWQYIVTASNEHEAEPARETAQGMGVDRVTFIPDGRGYDGLSDNARQRYSLLRKRHSRGCYWLWCMSAIQWEGTVLPCCYLQDSYGFSFGNAADTDFRRIWNGPRYKGARESFRQGAGGDIRKKDMYSAPTAREFEAFIGTCGADMTPCHMCSYYKLL